MERIRHLLEFAQRIRRQSTVSVPNPIAALWEADLIPVGSRRNPVCLFVGIGAQFHVWRKALADQIGRACFHGIDGVAWQRRSAWLQEILRTYYSATESAPALVWTAPIWWRLINRIKQSGLRREDTTLAVNTFDLSTTRRVAVDLRFANGHRFALPVCLDDYRIHDKDVRHFLRVPRRRIVAGTDFEKRAYEETVVIGNPDEVKRLYNRLYAGNDFAHRDVDGSFFLDLYSITLARVLVRESLLFSNMQRRIPQSTLLHRRLRPFGDGFFDEDVDATVEFLRFTLDPTDAQLVVPLGAVRTFERFLAEHFGLGELLAEAFPDRW